MKRVKLEGTPFFLYGRFIGDRCTHLVRVPVNSLLEEKELELFRAFPQLTGAVPVVENYEAAYS